MTEPTIFTFAEIEFAIAASPEQAATVRAQLHFPKAAESQEVLAAGVASLLARGLCTVDGTRVVPGAEVIAVSAALSTFTTRIEAIGWAGANLTTWHIFGGPAASIAVVPQGYGQFAAVPVNELDSIGTLTVRMLDALVGDAESGLVVRATTGSETSGLETTGVAIAIDADGTWYVSDTADSPDRGVPTTRDAAIERITAVLGSLPVGAAR